MKNNQQLKVIKNELMLGLQLGSRLYLVFRVASCFELFFSGHVIDIMLTHNHADNS